MTNSNINCDDVATSFSVGIHDSKCQGELVCVFGYNESPFLLILGGVTTRSLPFHPNPCASTHNKASYSSLRVHTRRNKRSGLKFEYWGALCPLCKPKDNLITFAPSTHLSTFSLSHAHTRIHAENPSNSLPPNPFTQHHQVD